MDFTNLLKQQATTGAVKAGAQVHSLNGDPISASMDSLLIKLIDANMDLTLLAEVTNDEIEILIDQVILSREAKDFDVNAEL